MLRTTRNRSIGLAAIVLTASAGLTACGSEDAASRLGEMQSGVVALLPAQANERLVYSCRAKEK